MTINPLVYYVSESVVSDSSPAWVDVPSPTKGEIAIVRSIEVHIDSTNGRRKLTPKAVMVDRYESGVEGSTRDNETALSTFNIPVSKARAVGVDFYREYLRYTSAIGLTALNGRGMRIYLNDKDKVSDYQRISIGVEILNRDDLV